LFKGDAVQPSWSANGHRIAYWGVGTEHERLSGPANIWTIAAEGGDSVPVTDNSSDDRYPVWAPDGTYIYFVSNRDGYDNIWRVAVEEATGTVLAQPERITGGTDSGLGPSGITRDGRILIYTKQVSSGRILSFEFNPVTGQVLGPPIPLATGSAHMPEPFDISRDGRFLAFRNRALHRFLIMRADTPWHQQTPMELPPVDVDNTLFSVHDWSPDNRYLVGEKIRTTGVFGGLLTYSLETKRHEELLDFGENPCWADNNRMILFIHQSKLFLIDVETRRYREVLSLLPTHIRRVRTSQNGRMIHIFCRVAERDIWLTELVNVN